MNKLNFKYVYIHEDLLHDPTIEDVLKKIKKPLVLIYRNKYDSYDHKDLPFMQYFLTIMSEDEMFDMALPSKTYKNYCAYLDLDENRIMKANSYGYFCICIHEYACDNASLNYRNPKEFAYAIANNHIKRYIKAFILFLLCLCCGGGSMYLNDGFFAFTLALCSIYFCLGALVYALNDKKMAFFAFLDMI